MFDLCTIRSDWSILVLLSYQWEPLAIYVNNLWLNRLQNPNI